MTVGLQLTFLRDISPHFEHHDKCFPKPSYGDWCVAGDVDYLTIRRLATISDIARTGSAEIQDALSPGGRVELNLFGNPHSNRQGEAEAAHVGLTAAADDSVVFVLSGTVSAVAMDRHDDFRSIRETINEAELYVRQYLTSAKLNQLGTFWTLGGPDLVSIIQIDSSEELPVLVHTIETIRSLLDSSKCSHIFSSLHGRLCYRRTLAKTSANSKWNSSDQNILYSFDLAVAPGHSHYFTHPISRFEHDSDAERPIRFAIGPGQASIHGQFENLYGLTRYLDSRIWQSSGAQPGSDRRNDVDSGKSSIAISVDSLKSFDPIVHHEHAAVVLSGTLIKILNKILNNTGTPFTGLRHGAESPYSRQERELQKVINTLYHASFRNERLGTIRDLVPFFRQLGNCFQHEKWPQYLAAEGKLELVVSDLNVVVNHLWRCIRNRIESRVETFDPSFPGTLDNGASKLVNAYSVVAWICWDLFVGSKHRDPSSRSCNAERFSAVVCSGSAGRVECGEVFSDFREFVERGGGNILCDPTEEWCSRLLLLNISGPSLLSPELAFGHCLHEMAEFCDWLALDPFEPIRNSVNEYFWESACAWIEEGLASTGLFEHDNERERNERTHRIHETLEVSLVLTKKIKFDSIQESRIATDSVLKTESPLKLGASIKNALKQLASHSAFKQRLSSISLPQREYRQLRDYAAIIRDYLGDVEEDNEFGDEEEDNELNSEFDGLPPVRLTSVIEQLDSLTIILRESLADLGMVFAVELASQKLCIKSHVTAQERVSYLFKGIIQGFVEWAAADVGDGFKRAVSLLVTRWAILDRSVSPTEGYQGWLGQFKERCLITLSENGISLAESDFDKMIESGKDNFSFFGDDESSFLSDCYRQILLQITSGDETISDQVNFWKSIKTPQADLLKQFVELLNDGSSQPPPNGFEERQIRFAFDLWAKSQKLSVEQAFERG